MRVKRIVFRYGGILALVIAVLIRISFGFSRKLYETVYFDYLFPVIRSIQSALSPVWVIPGYFLGFILIFCWLIYRFPRKRKWKQFLRRLLNFCSGLAALFLLLWGFNYANAGYATHAKLPPLPDSTHIALQYENVMQRAMEYRNKIDGISDTVPVIKLADWPQDSEINKWVQAVLAPKGYPVAQTVNVRHIRPKGTLRRISISGIYNPFTGEANVDAALPQPLMTFTIAHEIAHAYGVTSEAEANFVAWLACRQSEDPKATYAAEYALWRYIAKEVNKTLPEESIEILASKIPPPMQIDRKAVLKSYFRYKGYFPKISNRINDTYLKLQGVKSGTEDYDNFLKLYLRYERKMKESEKL